MRCPTMPCPAALMAQAWPHARRRRSPGRLRGCRRTLRYCCRRTRRRAPCTCCGLPSTSLYNGARRAVASAASASSQRCCFAGSSVARNAANCWPQAFEHALPHRALVAATAVATVAATRTAAAPAEQAAGACALCACRRRAPRCQRWRATPAPPRRTQPAASASSCKACARSASASAMPPPRAAPAGAPAASPRRRRRRACSAAPRSAPAARCRDG